MNLIDKYIAEVGKHLPGKTPADEATVMQLLKEYGSPREVAATYKTHQYLIGPRLFPIFEWVIRIVVTVVAGASLLGFGLGLTETGLTGPAFLSALGEWSSDLIGGLVAAFGNVVLVFAILERTKAATQFEKEFKEWDPQELEGASDPDKVELSDHIAALIFTFLGLVVLNLYPNLMAIRYMSGGTWVTLPVLTATFFSFLAWINITGALQIAFNGFMLGQKVWTPVTRILGILVDIAGMILGIVILRTPGIFGITPEGLNSIGLAEAANELSRLFNYLPSLIIFIVVIVTTIKVIKSLLQIFSARPKPPYLILK